MVTGGVCSLGPNHAIPQTGPHLLPPALRALTRVPLFRVPKKCVCVGGGRGAGHAAPLPPTLNSAAKGLLALSREVVSRRFW